ncbi:hypothetical protein COBT_000588, partial [Conglomerata obtusa]
MKKHTTKIENEYSYIYNDNLFNTVYKKEFLEQFSKLLLETYEKTGLFYLNLIETNFNSNKPLNKLLKKKFKTSMQCYASHILDIAEPLTRHADVKDLIQESFFKTFDSSSGVYDSDLIFGPDEKLPDQLKLNQNIDGNQQLLDIKEYDIKNQHKKIEQNTEFNTNPNYKHPKRMIRS